MICVACSQLEKLRMNLLNIGQKQKYFSETKEDDNQEYVYFSEIHAKLKTYIHHHQQILQLVTYFNYNVILAIKITRGRVNSRLCRLPKSVYEVRSSKEVSIQFFIVTHLICYYSLSNIQHFPCRESCSRTN